MTQREESQLVRLHIRVPVDLAAKLKADAAQVPESLCEPSQRLSKLVSAMLLHAYAVLESEDQPEERVLDKTQAREAGLWVHKRRTPMPAVKPGDFDKARTRRAKPAPVMPGTIHTKAKADGGICMVCNKPILKGQNIIWYKREKLATHSDCSA